MTTLPILYSFRRCPYAMRARSAIVYAGLQVELREVVLRDKPAALLQASPKGTVPVLQLHDGSVIAESLDIMHWALQQHDPGDRLLRNHPQQAEATALIAANDTHFKPLLDRYKYPERHPERTQVEYRAAACDFLAQLEQRLQQQQGGLCRSSLSLADMAIAPFIRQFAQVDRNWFDQAPYPALQGWLAANVGAGWFDTVMAKYEPWQPGHSPCIFPSDSRN
ncbi:Glutathione S-transferase [Andreprevotia lacus DSM 23236]|jgi:glutathione S-transferase|uniref:Glutathione S-transferase n=1 Tax=Andreprevotia lacus DSM 23236 TaxID=1121001 RepID=A0A1W1XE92_9NEIS|nr:glutathione S-transferase N-terminal domain-containing protein [Andreprevotia lacus]SMC21958.1 Glutathione S-transferase [Andreprevotia lacus DSM 23236]